MLLVTEIGLDSRVGNGRQSRDDHLRSIRASAKHDAGDIARCRGLESIPLLERLTVSSPFRTVANYIVSGETHFRRFGLRVVY